MKHFLLAQVAIFLLHNLISFIGLVQLAYAKHFLDNTQTLKTFFLEILHNAVLMKCKIDTSWDCIRITAQIELRTKFASIVLHSERPGSIPKFQKFVANQVSFALTTKESYRQLPYWVSCCGSSQWANFLYHNFKRYIWTSWYRNLLQLFSQN